MSQFFVRFSALGAQVHDILHRLVPRLDLPLTGKRFRLANAHEPTHQFNRRNTEALRQHAECLKRCHPLAAFHHRDGLTCKPRRLRQLRLRNQRIAPYSYEQFLKSRRKDGRIFEVHSHMYKLTIVIQIGEHL